MTLILSAATPAYALHVGDRLVSRGGTPHDPLANKSVVFRADDGLLAFGYTGPAFLRGMPTDTWIADALSGGCCVGDVGAVRSGEFPVRDVGSSLRMLCQRLRAEGEFRRLGGEVSAVGWQWRARRRRALVRNVLWVLHAGSGELRWEQIVPRHLPERKRVVQMVPTGTGRSEGRPGEGSSIGSGGPEGTGKASRACSSRRSGKRARRGVARSVATACPSCSGRGASPTPSSASRRRPRIAGPRSSRRWRSPTHRGWLPPDAIHTPAVLVGGLSTEQGLLTYAMEAPAVPGTQALKAAFQSQQRSDA